MHHVPIASHSLRQATPAPKDADKDECPEIKSKQGLVVCVHTLMKISEAAFNAALASQDNR
ncbi:hypothetical protein MPER_12487 [Moniliophthora perniciosa FA553]|nr:hypothetical protein MPER_12487 [Moniliophthora perniciosa FA553]